MALENWEPLYETQGLHGLVPDYPNGYKNLEKRSSAAYEPKYIPNSKVLLWLGNKKPILKSHGLLLSAVNRNAKLYSKYIWVHAEKQLKMHGIPGGAL